MSTSIAFIHSVFGKSNDHVQAHYEMQSGQIRVGFPSAGSWMTYGLGTESASLPAFVVINDPRGGPIGGPTNWSAGYMPAAYQGTLFRAAGDPIVDLKPAAGMTPETQRARLDLLAQLNELDMEKYPGSSDLAARISSYELAYRMQGCAPQAIDINNESEATKKLYGLDDSITEPFGRQCLLARRLVEHGVRFVQLFHGGMGNQNTDTWDAHSNVKSNHSQHAERIGSADCRSADRLESARPARRYAGHLARRVRAHADLSARHRPRSQPRRDDGLDGGRRHQGRPVHRHER